MVVVVVVVVIVVVVEVVVLVVDAVVVGTVVVGLPMVVVNSSSSSGVNGVVLKSSAVLNLALSTRLAKVTPLDNWGCWEGKLSVVSTGLVVVSSKSLKKVNPDIFRG